MNEENAANINRPVSPSAGDKEFRQPQQKKEQDMFQPAMQREVFTSPIHPRKVCFSRQHRSQAFFSHSKRSR